MRSSSFLYCFKKIIANFSVIDLHDAKQGALLLVYNSMHSWHAIKN
jgi:hypothetical protein